MLGINIITVNVAVWCPVHQPMIVSIVLDDFFHNAICMDESRTVRRLVKAILKPSYSKPHY